MCVHRYSPKEVRGKYGGFIGLFNEMKTQTNRIALFNQYYGCATPALLLELLEEARGNIGVIDLALKQLTDMEEVSASTAYLYWRRYLPKFDTMRHKLLDGIDLSLGIYEMVKQCGLYPEGSVVRDLYTKKIFEVWEKVGMDIKCLIMNLPSLKGSLLTSRI